MVQTNKILTVSYGTFSCTLEGFDESFDTMKAIAEYFRDLAADDRYFGAEPPTPDAEMLARIAEKEISRRVEARFENDGIVLRPSLTAAAPAPKAETTPQSDSSEPAPAAAPVVDPVAEPVAAVETPQTPEGDALEADTPDVDTEIDSAEAQDAALAEADAALTEPLSDIVEDAAGDVAADMAEDVAEDVADAAEDAPQAASLVEPAKDTAAEIVEADVEPAEEVTTPAPFLSADKVDDHAPGQDPAIKAASPDRIPESIAEKLARIRAVVSSAAAPVATAPVTPPVTPPPAPQEHAEEPATEEISDTFIDIQAEETVEAISDADTLGNIMSTLASGEAEDAVAPIAEEVIEAAGAAVSQDVITQEATKEDQAEVERAEEEAPEVAATETETPIADEPYDFSTEEYTAPQIDVPVTVSAPEPEDTTDAASVYDQDIAAKAGAADLDEATEAFDLGDLDLAEKPSDNSAETTPETSETPETQETPETVTAEAPIAPRRVAPRRPVRVVKVKRRQAQPEPAAPALADHGDSTLSPEDEADLMRELAAVTGDVAPQDVADSTVAEEAPQELADTPDAQDASQELADDTARTVRAMARRDRRDNFAEDEGDVSRLMAETDEQLQEPEGKSRRNAIAHLRAAVAATRADRGSEALQAGAEDRGEAYRDDLAKAVRPRRSTVETPQDRPRIAPLKLVAEQRVDLNEDADAAETAAQAVRPRRVSMPVDRDEAPEAGGFAAFAEEVGATRLSELLEAAAAYMSFVEGRDQFSRPQLMTKVRQIERSDSSREDRLRSFGQLLRDGKIEKVQGGRFTASDTIGFRPDDRAAG